MLFDGPVSKTAKHTYKGTSYAK